MRLLIIGGTVFLGRHLVAAALAAGHQVTTLNRGRENVASQQSVEKLIADREANLDILAGKNFDAVVDTCGYQPEVVEKSVKALKDQVQNYVFISSISAYGDFSRLSLTEADAVKYTNNGEGDYGSFKADCEKIVSDNITSSLIIRPGLIVGPFDPSDRFTYWPWRIAQGGVILCPGKPERTIQFIDVRDLATWIIKLVESNTSGYFNATGPKAPLTMAAFLQQCLQTISSDCKFVWQSDEQLLALKVTPWSELPLWVPQSSQDWVGFMQFDCSKAFAHGLMTRPLAETIADVLTWDLERLQPEERKAGLSLLKEKELLNSSSRL